VLRQLVLGWLERLASLARRWRGDGTHAEGRRNVVPLGQEPTMLINTPASSRGRKMIEAQCHRRRGALALPPGDLRLLSSSAPTCHILCSSCVTLPLE